MDDNNIKNNLDELTVDDEEIKRVEEMLKSSKSKRKKMIEERKPKNQSDSKFNFIELCKKNIVIPICLILAIAAIIFGIVYFAKSSKKDQINSLGLTYAQFTNNYHNTTLYNDLFSQFNTELPEITYKDDVENPNKELNYFAEIVPHDFTTYAIAIQGSTRKSDGQLTGIRIMYEVPTSDEAIEENATTLFLYYDMMMNSLFPELSNTEIDSMLAAASKSQEFEIYKNVAYRFTIQKADGISFYALDFAPAADYQSVEN